MAANAAADAATDVMADSERRGAVIPYERQELMVQALEKQDLLKLDDLQEMLPDVSMSTLRRDVKELERSGKVETLVGGAVKLRTASRELAIAVKNEINGDLKRAVAQCAAREVKDGDVVYVDSGSTGMALLELLVKRAVTIYTTNTGVCTITSPIEADVFVVGGHYNPTISSVDGPLVEMVLRDLFFDRAFLGVNAIDEERGVMTPGFEEAAKKRMVRDRSGVTYLLCDSSKFHGYSSVKVFDLEGVVVISDKRDAKIEECARMLTPEE